MKYLRAFLIVSRYEFMLGGVFFLFFVSALASKTWLQLRVNLPLIVLGSCVWFLSHLIGSQVNCLADYQIDLAFKQHLSTSVDRLGRRTIVFLLLIETALALACSIQITRMTGRPILTALWIFGWLLTGFYSLEPVRLKRRGLWNPISLTLVLYVLPIVFGYLALTTNSDPLVILVLFSTGIQMLSLILMNEVEDIPEDSAQAVYTPFVIYGVWPVSFVCLTLFLLGAVGTLIGLTLLIDQRVIQTAFLGIALMGQWIVARDLHRLVAVAKHQSATGGGATSILNVIRTLGGRNSLHFGILGITIAAGRALTLN